MCKKGNMFQNSAPECLIWFLEKVLSLGYYLKIKKIWEAMEIWGFKR